MNESEIYFEIHCQEAGDLWSVVHGEDYSDHQDDYVRRLKVLRSEMPSRIFTLVRYTLSHEVLSV